MRTLVRMFTLAFALSVASQSAPAASAAYKKAKAEYKEAKKEAKTIDKLIKKVNKSWDKGKDASKWNAQIQSIVEAEIGQLKSMGAKGPEKPKPVHPGDADKPKPPPAKADFNDKFLMALMDVKKKKKPGPRKPALDKLSNMYAKRLAIKEARKAKAK